MSANSPHNDLNIVTSARIGLRGHYSDVVIALNHVKLGCLKSLILAKTNYSEKLNIRHPFSVCAIAAFSIIDSDLIDPPKSS